MPLYEPPFRKSPLGEDRFKIPEKDTSKLGDKESLQENGFKKQAKEALGEFSRLWRRPKKKIESKEKALPQKKEKARKPEKHIGIFEKFKPIRQRTYSKRDFLSKMRRNQFRYDVFKKAKLGGSPNKKEILDKFYKKWDEVAKKNPNIYSGLSLREEDIPRLEKEFKKLRHPSKPKIDRDLGKLGGAIFGNRKK